MDAAMGLGKSWLSAAVLVGGTTGLITAVALTCIPSFALYPLIVHGKPFNHRDVNTLVKVAEPVPNPLLRLPKNLNA